MGVSGSGKSTVGDALAAKLGIPFLDGDSLHPASNVDKMAAGTPLNDADREPWLKSVGQALETAPDGLVVACSALKRKYRNIIRAAAPETIFVHLSGTVGLLHERVNSRTDHFMPPALLDSQVATLEPLQDDEKGLVLNISSPALELADSAQLWIKKHLN